MKTNKIVAGILAHVDSGKTTLAESMLYISGTIRKFGRVTIRMHSLTAMRWSGRGELQSFQNRHNFF